MLENTELTFEILFARSFETQRNGLVFIYDMAGSNYTNFELDLSKKILNLLKVNFTVLHFTQTHTCVNTCTEKAKENEIHKPDKRCNIVV